METRPLPIKIASFKHIDNLALLHINVEYNAKHISLQLPCISDVIVVVSLRRYCSSHVQSRVINASTGQLTTSPPVPKTTLSR